MGPNNSAVKGAALQLLQYIGIMQDCPDEKGCQCVYHQLGRLPLNRTRIHKGT